MPNSLHYRFVVLDPANQLVNPFVPGDAVVDEDHFYVTSLRDDTQKPYISSPPEGEGERIEPLTGQVSDASYTVRVADVPVTGGNGYITGDDFNHYRGSAFGEPSNPVVGGPWDPINLEAPYPTVPSGGVTGGIGGGTDPDDGTDYWYLDPGATYLGGKTCTALKRTFGVADGLLPNTQYEVMVRVKLAYSNIDIGSFQTSDGHNYMHWGLYIVGQATYGVMRTETTNRYYTIPPLMDTDPYYNPWNYWHTIKCVAVSDSSGDLQIKIGVFENDNWNCNMLYDNVRITQGAGIGAGRVVTRQLTDDAGLQRMLARRAFLEESEDAGATWRTLIAGYVTKLAFPTSMEAEFAVGDTRRVERTAKAFATIEGTFNNGTPIIGGPTTDGFGPVGYYGLPTFQVSATVAASGPYAPLVKLQYVGGPLPPGYKNRQDVLGPRLGIDEYNAINNRSDPYWSKESVYGRGFYPRLKVEVSDAGDGMPGFASTIAYGSKRLVNLSSPSGHLSWTRQAVRLIMLGQQSDLIDGGGHIYLAWPDILPSVGDRFYIRITPTDVSTAHPIHVLAHPADVVATLYADLNVSYDATSLTAVKNALGADLLVALRISTPEIMQSFIEKLFGMFGFATRIGDDGEREFFVTRLRIASAGVSLDMTDLREPEGSMWDIDETSVCNVVRVTINRFALIPQVKADDSQPFDWLVSREATRIADYDSDGDGTPERTTYGEHMQEYSLDGLIGFANVGEADLEQFTKALALQIFYRHGRGAPVSTFAFIRNGTTLVLKPGDDIALDTDHRPTITLGNNPTSARGGIQELTIVQRIDTPKGPVFRLYETSYTYVGTPTTSPIIPTFSITKDSAAPSSQIEYTITNGSTLTSASAFVEVYIGFGASAPTDNGMLYTTLVMGSLSSYVFTGGPFLPGTRVWLRMRSKIANQAWSNFSSWADVLLDSTVAFPSITTGTPAASACVFSWTNTSTVDFIEVRLQLGAVSGGPVIDVLPAGSTSYAAMGLTPNTQYTISFGYVSGNALGYQPTGAATSSTFTTANTALVAVQAPIALRATAGLTTASGVVFDGRCGLVVRQVDLPADIIFEVAEESSVGSGVAGGYQVFIMVPALGGGLETSAEISAPNDGLLRFFRAKATRPGYTDSTYSTALSINPWSGSSTITPGVDGSAGTPIPPTLSFIINGGTGDVDLYASVDSTVVSVKFAAGAVNGTAPSAGSVRAATADTTPPYTVGAISTLTPGDYVLVAAYAYDAFGNESAIARLNIQRSTAGGGNAFGTIQVSGQSDVIADSNSDTLTLVAGTGITITTTPASDSVTITAGTGTTALDDLADVNAPSPSDGDVLTWDAGGSEWVAAPSSGGAGGLSEWTGAVMRGSGVANDDFSDGAGPGWFRDNITGNAHGTSGDWRYFETGATISNTCGLYSGYTQSRTPYNPQMLAIIRLPSIADVRVWVGWFSTSPNSSDSPVADSAGFRFSTGASDTNWQCISEDGSTSQTTDSGVAVASSTTYDLRVHLTSTSVEFYINGTLVATHTTRVPTNSVSLGTEARLTTLANASKQLYYSRIKYVDQI